MPIVLDPVEGGGGGQVTCETVSFASPVDGTLYDCPVKMGVRTVVATTGQQAYIDFEMRDARGNQVNIDGCILAGEGEDPGFVLVRFQEFRSCNPSLTEIEATVVDGSLGKIRFQLPAAVVATPGIWQFEVGVYNTSGVLIFTNKGLLSVERGLFGSDTSAGALSGMPTITEIRTELRDMIGLNDLRDELEASDAEILHALVKPVQDWNETPPYIGTHTPESFPYRVQWLHATCGYILRSAAIWYERNKLNVSTAGVSDQERDKLRSYMQIANVYLEEWREFVKSNKISLNWAGFYGSVE